MRNIKKIMLAIGMLFIFSVFCRGIIIKADVVTVPFKDDNGIKSINIIDLAKAINLEVKKENNKIEMTINNKKLFFDPEESYVYLDDQILTLKSRSVLDIENSEIYKLPILSKITKEGEGYLFPQEFIEKYLNIRCSNNGIIVNNNKVETTEDSSTEKADSNKTISPSKNTEKIKEEEKVEEKKKTNNAVEAPEAPEAPESPEEPEAPDPIIFN
jgi:hypothetical protein